MRSMLVSLAALTAIAGGAPAFALNPQPLPPGLCAQDAPHCLEPPNPCLQYRAHRQAYARCLRLHPRPQSGVTEPPDPCQRLVGKAFANCRMEARKPPRQDRETIGSGTTGAGAGK